MIETHLEAARAAIKTSSLLQQRSMEGTAAFRNEMDQSRKAVQQSRELLKRLRQRLGDGLARGWQDDPDLAPVAVSAFDADILRSAFRELVRERSVPECVWRDLATSLVFEFTGCEQIDVGLLDWITHKSPKQPVPPTLPVTRNGLRKPRCDASCDPTLDAPGCSVSLF
jgi:hypothetical protein